MKPFYQKIQIQKEPNECYKAARTYEKVLMCCGAPLNIVLFFCILCFKPIRHLVEKLMIGFDIDFSQPVIMITAFW